MPRLYIWTNEEKIRYGNKEYMENYKTTATRWTSIVVSNEIYDALLGWHIKTEEEKKEISYELYCILDRQWISNN